jgi:hypothetical protein
MARDAPSADRILLVCSAVIAVFAVATRLHNVAAYPAMHDWDAGGHAVNVVDLLELHWPNPRSWCGSHPPLYYALSALLTILLPERVPVHVTMRLVSAGAWVATVALVWRALRRLGNPIDAAVVSVLLLGMPGLTIASCMMTNDALCALFTTATLVRLLDAPPDRVPSAASVAVTGALAGLAATTKATGVAAVGIAALFYLWRARHDWRSAVRSLAVLGLVSAAIAGPHYARLFVSLSGSPYDVLAVRAGSQEKEVIATLVHEIARAHTRFSSFAALFHTALWGDPTVVYLPEGIDGYALSRLVWAGGFVPTAVALAGAVRLLVRREQLATIGVAMVFGVSFAAALAPHAIDRPYIVLTKTNYMLPEALPVGIVLALGLASAPGRARTAIRLALLVLAAGAALLTTYGWWGSAPAAARSSGAEAAVGSPAHVVERYFAWRARDPVRALRLLAPEVQLAHGLRLAPILGLPPLAPESGLIPDDARSLELARARVAWLELYNLVRWMQPITTALDVDPVAASSAEVRVRVGAYGTAPPPGGDIGLWPFPPFAVRFTLARARGDWLIAGVEEADVIGENTVPAFVTHPTWAGFERLRSLGWEPPWARAVASVLQDR